MDRWDNRRVITGWALAAATVMVFTIAMVVGFINSENQNAKVKIACIASGGTFNENSDQSECVWDK